MMVVCQLHRKTYEVDNPLEPSSNPKTINAFVYTNKDATENLSTFCTLTENILISPQKAVK